MSHAKKPVDTSNAKVERYEWSKPGPRGDFKWVPVKDINTDDRYQRGLVGHDTILKIARDLNWVAFGALVVAERDNGSLWAMDGKQRTEAVMVRGDIERIPCLVFKSEGIEWEAEMFRLLNLARKPVGSYFKFASAVVARLSPQVEIHKYCKAAGIAIVEKARRPGEMNFVDILTRTWINGKDEAVAALDAQRKIATDCCLHAEVHKGLWYCLRNGVPVGDFIEKIIEAGGISNLKRRINTALADSGAGAKSNRICGHGVLKVINHKLQKRYRFGEIAE